MTVARPRPSGHVSTAPAPEHFLPSPSSVAALVPR